MRLSSDHLQAFGTIAAALAALIALFVAWDQGRVMRQEVRASVWPALQVQGFVDTEGGGLEMGLNVENAGVGPALVERISVFQNNELVTDLDDLEARMQADVDLSFETASGRIIAAGDSMQPFSVRFEDPSQLMADGEEVTPRAAAAIITRAWRAEVCYCSSLGDCWVSDTTTNPPAAIDQCDADPASNL